MNYDVCVQTLTSDRKLGNSPDFVSIQKLNPKPTHKTPSCTQQTVDY
jgi:hypothetical protein